MRLWNRLAYFAHRLKVSSHSVLEVAARLFFGVTGSRASRNIRRIGGLARSCLFNNHRIAFQTHFQLVLLSLAFNVPGMSSFIYALSSRRMTSRTFIGMTGHSMAA
jgi:hypothetical protein